jgi:threonylcarbamoyladenosine tRNA methylthiotransferase MtaB
LRYSILTFGCRVNQAESLALEAEVRARGHVPADALDADLIVVNSCSVTATADQGTRQAIRRIARENPSARVVVTGCYATRRPDEVAALPGVVRLVRNGDKDALVAHIADLLDGSSLTTAERYGGGRGPCGARDDGHAGAATQGVRVALAVHSASVRPGTGGRTAFTLRVQTGCEEQCAYCIIPSTRGVSRSTPLAQLAEDVRRLEDAGYREVTLTGVHLGAYGRDLPAPLSLVPLVEALLAATDRLVFRLGSLEPMDCPPTLVRIAEATPRLAPAFHLPLQHASDRLLRAMRRPYTCAAYAATVDDIRRRLPHAAITADVIAGFPGEGEDDAETLARYLEGSPLTQLHVFPYSDRPGTQASQMPGKVHGAAIRERGARIRAIGRQLADAFRASQEGRVCRALTIEDGRVVITDNGLRAGIAAGHARNEHVRVRLSVEAGTLTGRVLEGSRAVEACAP